MFPIRDDIPSRTTPYVTISIIAINIVVFLFELGLGSHLPRFFNDYSVIPAIYTHPVYWSHFGSNLWTRIFASMFLHGGWMHLIGNLWILWIFGDNVEDRLGHFRYLLFYLAAGIASMVVHIGFSANSQLPTIGASGAIAGVMGAYFVFYPRARVLTLLPIIFLPIVLIPAWVYLGYWLFMQFIVGIGSIAAGGSFGGIAWWAHVGGFGAGYLFARRMSRKNSRRRYYRDEYRPW